MTTGKSRGSFRRWILGAAAVVAAAFSLARPQVAAAGPNDGAFTWSITAYVRSYGEANDGNVSITFQNANGNQITHFPNSAGTNICPGGLSLLISKTHPQFERLAKAFQAGGLARRLLWFGYEPTAGRCYLKTVEIFM